MQNLDPFYNELKQYKEELEKLDRNTKLKRLTKLKYDLAKKYNIQKLPTNIEIFLNTNINIVTKPTRTISGVSVIAIMTKPHLCPHAKTIGPCIMCPGGVDSFYGNVPQSYTGKEPATMRGIRNDYDAYLQTFNRLEQYVAINQSINKIELIIMGGTFPSYDMEYQNDFIINAFKAMNDFSEMFLNKNNEIKIKEYLEFFEMPGDMKDSDRIKRIKEKTLKLKEKNKTNLEQEQLRNQNDSKIKCIALVIETRPDYAKKEQIKNMLRQGCTRIELGVQSIHDKTLEFLKRGHSVNDTIQSTKLMKDSLLKVGYHMMLGIEYNEFEIFKELFDNQNFKPDALKLYPILVIKGTKLYELWRKGEFKTQTMKHIIELIAKIKAIVPEYVRIMRVQRDIPHTQVEDGIKKTNLRQYVTKYMNENNMKCNCIRCREIKNKKINDIEYKKYYYDASGSKEVFISAESNNKLIGFLRLRLVNKPIFNELENCAGIRELHVYGTSLKIGEKSKKSSQHKGIGKELIKIAEDISKNKFKVNKIAVISGVGVRNYYEKLGYKLKNYYMIKEI